MPRPSDLKTGATRRQGPASFSGVATKAAGHMPVLGNTVVAPAIRRLIGQPAPVFSASVTEDALQDLAHTVLAMIRSIETSLSGELDARGEKEFTRHLIRAVDEAADFIARWHGAPYGGPKDAARMVRNLTSGAPVDLRRELRRTEGERDLRQERRQLLRAMRQNDTRAFRRAVEAMEAKGEEVTFDEVVATVNRRYGFLTRYERGKPDREKLPPKVAELVDHHAAERDALRSMAEDLARENADLLARGRRRRRQRPARPRRQRR